MIRCILDDHAHSGAVRDCLTEALLILVRQGWHDGMTGDSYLWDHHLTLVSDAMGDDLVRVDAGSYRVPAGSYLIYEYPSGMIFSERLAFTSVAWQRFDRSRHAYEAWRDAGRLAFPVAPETALRAPQGA